MIIALNLLIILIAHYIIYMFKVYVSKRDFVHAWDVAVLLTHITFYEHFSSQIVFHFNFFLYLSEYQQNWKNIILEFRTFREDLL